MIESLKVCCLWIHETSYIEEEGIRIYGLLNGLSKNLIYLIQCTRHDNNVYSDALVTDHLNYDCPNDDGIPSMHAYPIELVPDQGNYHKDYVGMTYNKTGVKAVSIIKECFSNLQVRHPNVFNYADLVFSKNFNKNIAEDLDHAKL